MFEEQKQNQYLQLTHQYLSNHIDKGQINDLKEILRFHEWKYYVKNQPIIADVEYDQLYQKLVDLEKQFPELIEPNSPTQRVGSDIISTFNKVKHLSPMLSLGNSYNQEDLKDFDVSIRKVTNDQDIRYAVEPKFDGGSIAIVYENDQLVRATTRGNGEEGEDITANVRIMNSVPLQASFSKHGIQTAEIRGEALIRKDRFLKLNAQREEQDLELFANPRNTATGGLRTKDPKETANREIELFAFQISYAVNQNGTDQLPAIQSHSNAIEMLGSLGFKIPFSQFHVCENIEQVVEVCKNAEVQREEYPYEIDGMVVKVNDIDLQNKVGWTSHHPKWAIAFKFKAKQATSTLDRVEFQVGKIGSITPVAKIQPIQLAGVTVSSISLHNEDFITKKDIRIGDKVLVERAGDVIPYIVKSFPDLREGDEEIIQFPTHCPSCETELVKVEGEAVWRCVNITCEAQTLQRMIHHVSKDAMNIDGFGRSYIERFYELGWVEDISDIYHLDYDKIAELEGFGEKSAQNLEQAIEKAKQNPLYRILHSLSIYQLGKKASKVLAEHVKTIYDFQDWTEEDYTSIKDVGPILAREVMEFFHNPVNIEILKKMEEYGVDMSQKEADKPLEIESDAPLVGKTILFTGSLQQMTRKEAQEKAALAGAKNISAVSSNLDILVVGEKAGSKLKKAQALGSVEILTEDEFLNVLS